MLQQLCYTVAARKGTNREANHPYNPWYIYLHGCMDGWYFYGINVGKHIPNMDGMGMGQYPLVEVWCLLIHQSHVTRMNHWETFETLIFYHLRDASKIYPPPKKWVKVKKNRSTIISLHGIFSPPKKINNDVLTLELGEKRQQQQKPIARSWLWTRLGFCLKVGCRLWWRKRISTT